MQFYEPTLTPHGTRAVVAGAVLEPRPARPFSGAGTESLGHLRLQGRLEGHLHQRLHTDRDTTRNQQAVSSSLATGSSFPNDLATGDRQKTQRSKLTTGRVTGEITCLTSKCGNLGSRDPVIRGPDNG